MKKSFIVLLLVLAVIGCAFVSCSKGAKEDVIRIGVFEPQSGDNGAGGKQEVLGIQYANTIRPTVTLGGKEYKVVLDIQDNQSTTDKAVSAAQQLVADKCTIVLGSYGSGVSMAGGPYFRDAKIPAIGVSCTNAGVTAGNDYYFRMCFLDPFQGSVMANFAKTECGAKKAYVLSMLGEDYGVGLAKNFIIAFKEMGGTVVADETFVEGTSDFSSYIQNAIDLGADVIFAPSATTYAALIIKQAATKGLSIPVLGGDTWESPVISDAQQGTNVKVFVSTAFDENDESGDARKFVSGLKNFMNTNPTMKTNNGGSDIVAAVSALGFDSYNLACDVLELAGTTDGETLKNVLASFNGNGFVTGALSFDSNGDARKTTAYIKQAVNGAFDFVKVQSTK